MAFMQAHDMVVHGREPVAADQAAFAAPLPPRPPPRADPAKALADKDAQRRWILQYAQDEPSSGEDGSQVRHYIAFTDLYGGCRMSYMLQPHATCVTLIAK